MPQVAFWRKTLPRDGRLNVLKAVPEPSVPLLLIIMRRFHFEYAFGFLLIILVTLFATRWFHGRIEGRYQAETARVAAYGFEDWIGLLKVDTLVGEPPVTPQPADKLPFTPSPRTTPAP